MSFPAFGLFMLTLAVGGVACSSGGSLPTGAGGGGGATGSGGATGAAGSSGAFVNAATCGERGTATANATAYAGTTEFFIIGEAGLGADVCVVRFDVMRIGAAPAGCPSCNWAHLVEFTNPTVITNVGGACDASDSVPPLDAAGRVQMTGARGGRGFSLTTGHGDALLKYSDAMQMWLGVGRANWDEAASALGYNISNGNCNYGR